MAKVKDDWARKHAPSTLVGSTAKSHGKCNDVNSTMDIWLKIQEQQSKPLEKNFWGANIFELGLEGLEEFTNKTQDWI